MAVTHHTADTDTQTTLYVNICVATAASMLDVRAMLAYTATTIINRPDQRRKSSKDGANAK